MNKYLLILASSLLITPVALAAPPIKDRGGYIGGAIGATKFSDDNFYDFRSIDIDLDENSYGYQIFGGYRFLKYFALEGRFTHLGEFEYTASTSYYGVEKQQWKHNAFTVNAMGIYPFGQSGFDIYGQLGAGILNIDLSRAASDADFDDTGGVFTLGAGVRYTPPGFQAMTFGLGYDIYYYAVELEVDSFAPFYSSETYDYDQSISMLKLSAQYNF